ncbi:hypothetical protein G7Y89_g14659 [Cudoniella acicularis]|uniref:Uncharacterized protein n=1 Tax=Cudoniella acicularis TaxID=354080 RepID=A0A8H4QZ29_9HELO|nr:hypothetical protein G7Y89_g14659 [Cudoniella acicularis]
MLCSALSPQITDYTLEVKYEKDGDDFEVIEKVTEGLKVLLSDSEKAKPLASKAPISLFDNSVDPKKDDVKDLEEGRGWIFDAKDQNGTLIKDVYPSSFNDLVEREAVRLGEKFQIASKWCSFVAVVSNDKEIADKAKRLSTDEKIVDDFDIIDHSDEEIVEYQCEITYPDATTAPQATQLRSAAQSFSSSPKGAYKSRARPSASFGLFGSSLNAQEQAFLQPEILDATLDTRSGGGVTMASFGTTAVVPDRINFGQLFTILLTHLTILLTPIRRSVSPSAPALSVPTSIADKVLALISIQDFDGFWASDADKQAFLIIGITDTSTPDGEDANVWLTVLVIKFLQDKCAKEQGTWELVVEKAQAWLDRSGDIGLENLEKNAGVLLG